MRDYLATFHHQDAPGPDPNPPIYGWVMDLMDGFCGKHGGSWDRVEAPQGGVVAIKWIAPSGYYAVFCYEVREPNFGPVVAHIRLRAVRECVEAAERELCQK